MRPDDDAHKNTSAAMLALPDNSQDDHRTQADQSAMPLALVPQRMEAVPAGARKRRLPTPVQAILISACLTVALILTLGMLKGNRNAPQVAQAETAAPLATAASSPTAASGQPLTNSPAFKKETAARHASRAGARQTALASKTGTSTPPSGKQRSHARPEHRMAENGKKKPAATTAKAQKQPFEEHDMPALAQNSVPSPIKAGSAQGSYAQCQELGNFFRREQCKWQVCNGKWGQDGCPAYSNGNKEFN